jgi:hypothetical protein
MPQALLIISLSGQSKGQWSLQKVGVGHLQTSPGGGRGGRRGEGGVGGGLGGPEEDGHWEQERTERERGSFFSVISG